jgi:hypothetical protein
MMPRFLIRRAVGAIFAFGAFSHTAFALDRGLCNSDETSVFICQNGAKIASLCSSQANGTKRLRYVFGAPKKIELSYPPDGVAAKDAFRNGDIMYSGIGGEYIQFTKAPFDYFVFYVMGGGTNFRGVIVEKNKKNIGNQVCTGKSDDDLTTPFFNEMQLPHIQEYEGFEVPDVFWRPRK